MNEIKKEIKIEEKDKSTKDGILFVTCFWDMPLINLEELHKYFENYFLESNEFNAYCIEVMSKRITKQELQKLIPEKEYNNISHLFKEKLGIRIPHYLDFAKKKDK